MRQMTRNLLPAAATGIGLLIAAGAAWAEPSCSASAHTRRLACEFDLRDDDFTAAAQCHDWATPDPACCDDAGSEFDRAKLGVLVISSSDAFSPGHRLLKIRTAHKPEDGAAPSSDPFPHPR